ncbi:MAG: hypothetical protein HUJ22_02740 [Gracilimonas sp.]|uniref:NUDIX hydrolase n=1 Tax=Gracilimonas sp. TaxID=1974203 RepID=UPI0019CBB0A8|nr:hypothetical protein [Gracilimonas sp.]MBD3615462.1 hypothetical protein [Gracilimonas sp.]
MHFTVSNTHATDAQEVSIDNRGEVARGIVLGSAQLLTAESVDSINTFELPDLIFSHDHMVEAALKRLCFKASHQPVGFELLPDKFTLPELQKLYEGIYDTRLDKRNFRRRILSMDVLVKTDEKQKKYSKKGAYLYEFDKEKYSEKVTKGDILGFKPLRT